MEIKPSQIDKDFDADVFTEYEEDYMKESIENESLFKVDEIKDSDGNLTIKKIGTEFNRKGEHNTANKKRES